MKTILKTDSIIVSFVCVCGGVTYRKVTQFTIKGRVLLGNSRKEKI